MSGETPDIRRPTITPPRYRTEGLPAELRETAAVRAAVEALRAAVDHLDTEPGRDAAAAAWHAQSVVRFFCSTYPGTIARRARERGQLHRAPGRGSRWRRDRRDDRGRAGRHVPVQGEHR